MRQKSSKNISLHHFLAKLWQTRHPIKFGCPFGTSHSRRYLRFRPLLHFNLKLISASYHCINLNSPQNDKIPDMANCIHFQFLFLVVGLFLVFETRRAVLADCNDSGVNQQNNSSNSSSKYDQDYSSIKLHFVWNLEQVPYISSKPRSFIICYIYHHQLVATITNGEQVLCRPCAYLTSKSSVLFSHIFTLPLHFPDPCSYGQAPVSNGSIHEQALCPWTYETNYNPSRIPSRIEVAVLPDGSQDAACSCLHPYTYKAMPGTECRRVAYRFPVTENGVQTNFTATVAYTCLRVNLGIPL